MRIGVIGGTGLIGARTAGSLARDGHEVIVLSRSAQADETHAARRVDIGDAEALRGILLELRPDAVLHLAAYLQFACERNPAEAIRSNVTGTLNVLEACRAARVRRLVFGSSIAVYGSRTDRLVEDTAPEDPGLYGSTKRLGEMLGQRYARLHGLEFLALRYSGVFGPGQVRSPGMALVRQQIRETANGMPIVLDSVSGDERCHLTHVDDAVGATVRALVHARPRHDVFNVAGPDENYLSLCQFHAEVRALVPAAGAVRFTGRGPEAGRIDTTRLREDLGYVPALTVAEGLRRDLAAVPQPG